MELLTSCFPCCCPPEAASRVTSELKLIEEPGVRPPYHHRLGSTLSVDGDAGETPTSSGAGPSSGGGDTPPHLYPSDTAKLLPGEGAPAGAIRIAPRRRAPNMLDVRSGDALVATLRLGPAERTPTVFPLNCPLQCCLIF